MIKGNSVLSRRRVLSSLAVGIALVAFSPFKKPVRLFDGKTFKGWEGDTVRMWRVENGSLIGGSLTEKVPNNDFLVTTRTYKNFDLRLKFRLRGSEGFINTGVQFHSQRLKNPAYEMTGYQADLGDKYWASLYDESRRNKTLIAPDSALVEKILKRNEWNDYQVTAQDGHIRIKLNGVQTVDYYEPDKSIPQSGLIGLQIHGGGKAEVAFRDMVIEEL